jgi:hypothetical protein
MDQQQKRQDHIDTAAKARSMAQERRAVQTAEIAGKQAQLKQEAQERREQKSQSQPGTKKTRSRAS